MTKHANEKKVLKMTFVTMLQYTFRDSFLYRADYQDVRVKCYLSQTYS